MVITRLTITVILHSFSYPRAMVDVLTTDDVSDTEVFDMLVEGLVIDVRADTVIGVLTDVMVGGMPGDVKSIVVAAVVIDLEFDVIVSCGVDVLPGVIICGVSDIDVGVLAGVSVGFLTAVRTDLIFVTTP